MLFTHHTNEKVLYFCSDGSGPARKQLKKEMRNSDSDNEVMKKWKTRSRGGEESGMHNCFLSKLCHSLIKPKWSH